MNTSRIRVLCLALLLTPASACGTALYNHEIQITIDDPTHKLGAQPLEVAVFDSRMGSSAEYARRTMGRTSDGAPYKTTFSTTAAALAFSAPRPDSLQLSVAVPGIVERGFLVLNLKPGVTLSGDGIAAFALYAASQPAGDGPQVSYHYVATPLPKGWALNLQLKAP